MKVANDPHSSSDEDASFSKDPVDPQRYLSKSDIERIQAWIDHDQRDVLSSSETRESDAAICMESIRNGILRPVSVNELKGPELLDFGHPEQATIHSGSVNFANRMPASERYLNPTVIGVGGFGVVISVFDRILGVPVALKFLRPSLGKSSQIRNRFVVEAQTTASLFHHGIIRTYELACIDSHLTISCALASGGSLAELKTKSSRSWTSQQAAWFIGEIADAVQYAHSMATLHRDLKPANVLLAPSDLETSHQLGFQPLLTDFGLAKKIDFESASEFQTGDGQLLGTSLYMSPEQARGDSRHVGTGSDIFSLGVILYELLTGQTPFHGNNPFEIRSQIVRGQVIRPRALRRSIPRDLEAIVLKCLEPDPASRYATAHELRSDLRRFLNGELVQATRYSWPLSTARLMRRHPVLSGLAALSLTAIMVAIGGLITALRVQQVAHEREIVWRSREQNTLREMVTLYTDVTDRVIAGKPLEISDLVPSLERSVRLLESATAEEPFDPKLLHRLTVLKHYLSTGYQREGKHAQAVQVRDELLRTLADLQNQDPENPKYQFDSFISLLALADMCRWTIDGECNFDESFAYLERAMVHIESLCRDFPDNLDYQDAHVAALNCKGVTLEQKHPKLAIEYLDAAARKSRELWSQYPDRPELGKCAFLAPTRAAGIRLELGERDKALSLVREGITVYRQVRYPLKDETGLLLEAIAIGSRFRSILIDLGEREEAILQIQAMRDAHRLLEKHHVTAELRMEELVDYFIECELLLELSRLEEAADREAELLRMTPKFLEVSGLLKLLKAYQANHSLPEGLATLIEEYQSIHSMD